MHANQGSCRKQPPSAQQQTREGHQKVRFFCALPLNSWSWHRSEDASRLLARILKKESEVKCPDPSQAFLCCCVPHLFPGSTHKTLNISQRGGFADARAPDDTEGTTDIISAGSNFTRNLGQRLSDCSGHRDHLRVCGDANGDYADLGTGLGVCISDRLPGEADWCWKEDCAWRTQEYSSGQLQTKGSRKSRLP